MSDLTNTLNKGVFLLIIGLSTNFIVNTVNCSAQKILTNNVIIRHLLILAVIQFTLENYTEYLLNIYKLMIKYKKKYNYNQVFKNVSLSIQKKSSLFS